MFHLTDLWSAAIIGDGSFLIIVLSSVSSYPCIQCHSSFPTVQTLLVHAAIVHFAKQLQEQFNISPSGGSSCHACCHTFSCNSDLLKHLGLAHKGLLKEFYQYKACGLRILEKKMDAYRLAEQRVFECKLCPLQEFSTHEQAASHVNECHLSLNTCQNIMRTLGSLQWEEGLTCERCSAKFKSKLAGWLHLERCHRWWSPNSFSL
jgi:hypothetical protein